MADVIWKTNRKMEVRIFSELYQRLEGVLVTMQFLSVKATWL